MDKRDLENMVNGLRAMVEQSQKQRENQIRAELMQKYPELGVLATDDEDTMHTKTRHWFAQSLENVRRFNAHYAEPDGAADLVKGYAGMTDWLNGDTIENHIFRDPCNGSYVLNLETLFDAYCEADLRLAQQALVKIQEQKRTKQQQAPTQPFPWGHHQHRPDDTTPHFISVN